MASSSTDELWAKPIVDLMPLLRSRQISPLDVAHAALNRIDDYNPSLRAFCVLEPERVLSQAGVAERQLLSGEPVGALCGIPIGVKDLIFTQDLVTAGGSEFYRDFVPKEDDIVVERLRAAGAVILGKTNVPEFGFGPGSSNSVYGKTRNPWDHTRTPGGSSGGSAVAVATGMAPAALGSDGGGSIRVPSSFCGVYGLKPSFGRVPLYPGCRDARFPGFSGWETLEHIGPMTRSVLDAALVLDVIAGPDPRDRHSIPRDGASFAGLESELDLAGLRIAWSLDLGGYARVDPAVRLATESTVQRLEMLGAHIIDVNAAPPFSIDPSSFFETVVALDADLNGLRDLVDGRSDRLNPRIRTMLTSPPTFEAASRAVALRQTLYNQLWRFFTTCDLLVTPTTPVAAFDVDRALPEHIDDDERVPPAALSWFTLPFNLTGNPAASVPCGWTADGLPVGLQIIGNHLDDRTVLRASRALEVAAPWTTSWPYAQ
jgi:aspartyl-tRNA(Asn)/glutamyl-tRNA(Gln) amidotransferase subunit A